MSEKKIKVYLVDDHRIFVRGVASLLGTEEGLSVEGYASDAATVMAFLPDHSIDVLITDVQMPGTGGIELCRKVKENFPDIRVIGLSMLDKAEIIRELISAGAEGYLLKDIEKPELVLAIKEVFSGNTYYSSQVAATLVRSIEGKDLLTKREKEIIRLIAAEQTNAMIADRLFISEHTVESHRKNIFRKTQAKSIVGLVKYAYENKII